MKQETPSVSQVSQFTLESTSLCAASIQFELLSLIKKPSELDADVCRLRWQGNLSQEMSETQPVGFKVAKHVSQLPVGWFKSLFKVYVNEENILVWDQKSATNPPLHLLNYTTEKKLIKKTIQFLQDTKNIYWCCGWYGTWAEENTKDIFRETDTLIWVKAEALGLTAYITFTFVTNCVGAGRMEEERERKKWPSQHDYVQNEIPTKCQWVMNTFTFMHLADAFIQSDLH